MTAEDAAARFQTWRPLLIGVAYRMLGSMWDAEDVVQEAYVRWMRTDRGEVREPRAFLITVVSRLALDQLRSARATRESYVGPWLPEPVDTAAAGPLDTAELRDTLSYATLHLMERLTPPERAVFVLREAFAMPYEEIAAVIGAGAATCRQLHHRAGLRLDGAAGPEDGEHAGERPGRGARAEDRPSGRARARGRARTAPSADEHRRLLTRLVDATRGGDLDALTALFAEDVVAWSDGGGKTRAALRPVAGSGKVAAFILGLYARYPLFGVALTEANGQPALRTRLDGRDQIVLLDVRDGRISGLFSVLNPDKLGRLAPVDF